MRRVRSPLLLTSAAFVRQGRLREPVCCGLELLPGDAEDGELEAAVAVPVVAL